MKQQFKPPFDDVTYRESTRQRLYANLKKAENGCLEWQGYRLKRGYGQIHIMNRGKEMAHRIAFELANGSFPPQLFVRHVVCDNPPCCNPQHLALGTHGKNMRDMTKRSRQTRGEQHPNAKLSRLQVEIIFKLWETGRYTQTEIAQKMGVTPRNISLILSGSGWSHAG